MTCKRLSPVDNTRARVARDCAALSGRWNDESPGPLGPGLPAGQTSTSSFIRLSCACRTRRSSRSLISSFRIAS